jgi:hypothetical protein
MSRKKVLKEDLELDELIQSQLELSMKEKAFAEIPKRLAQEIKDRETTMPPLLEIEERKQRILHEQIISRGQVINIQRDQTRSLSLIFLLLAATAALIWWGVRLMQG